MNNQEFATMIRTVAIDINADGPKTIAECIKPFYDVGVFADIHTDDPDNFGDLESIEGHRRQLEWFAGQCLTVVENDVAHLLQAWLDLVEKMTMRPSEWEAKNAGQGAWDRH